MNVLSALREGRPTGPEKRRSHRKSFSVNMYYESRALADFCDLFNLGRLFGDWLGFTSDFPGNPKLRLFLSQI